MPQRTDLPPINRLPDSIKTRYIAANTIQILWDSADKIEEALHHSGWTLLAEKRDQAFCRLMVLTALRHWGQIRHILQNYIKKPVPQKDWLVLNILSVSLTQLLFLETPPHAVINTAVETIKSFYQLKKYQGFVNAILRQFVRDQEHQPIVPDIQHNYAPWLWQAWVKTYGLPQTQQIAEAHVHEPGLHISIKGRPEYWADQLKAEILPMGGLYLKSPEGRIEQLPGYDQGEWWVQNAAAALPAKFLQFKPGDTVLDICAAPGGKTAQLSAAGAKVIALEISAERLKMLEENLGRLHLQAELVEADANNWRPTQPLRFILLDAPCSSTGTIRRHPEIAWRRKREELSHLIKQQRDLLQSSYQMLAKGGQLVYATCSLLREEGEGQLDWLLKKYPDLNIVPILPAEVGGLSELITDRGELRTLPYHLLDRGGLDGFYAVRLQRLA